MDVARRRVRDRHRHERRERPLYCCSACRRASTSSRHANQFFSIAVRQGLPAFWVAQPVTVGASDIEDLTVELRPALRVEGRLEFRGASGLTPRPRDVHLRGYRFETPFGEPGQFAVQPRGRRPRSATVAAGGRYIARPFEIGGWFVQSVTLDGKDITDESFDLQADATNLVVAYTDRPSKVSGTVKDARGAASANAIVLAFPVDPAAMVRLRHEPALPEERAGVPRAACTRSRTCRPATTTSLRLTTRDADGWTDPKTLEALARQATRLTVVDSEPKTLDLTLKVDPMIRRRHVIVLASSRSRAGAVAAAAAGARQRAGPRSRHRDDLRQRLRGRHRRDEAAGAPRARDAQRTSRAPFPARPRPPTTPARSRFVACRRAGSRCRRSRPAISRASYGASRPERAGTPIVVKDGEPIANIVVTIARGGVITGVVRDVRGRPVAGRHRARVAVRVQRARPASGRSARRAAAVPARPMIAASTAPTDCRPAAISCWPRRARAGSFRRPGRRRHSPADDRRKCSRRCRRPARAVERPPAAPLPPSLSPSSARVNYAPVFHPGVTDIGAAATIALGLSEERTRRGHHDSVRADGHRLRHGHRAVRRASAVAVAVALVPAGPQRSCSPARDSAARRRRPRADGTYVFAGVAPGTYTVKATRARAADAARRRPAAPALWAAADVTVNGQDLTCR